MTKLAGALVLILTASFWGMEKSLAAKRENEALSELYDFFELLSRRICEKRQSLESVCREGGDGFAKRLSDADLDWERALCGMSLPGGVRTKLISVSKTLGGVSASSELEICAEISEYLSKKLKSSELELGTKLPLYRSLWLIAGLAAVIILM